MTEELEQYLRERMAFYKKERDSCPPNSPLRGYYAGALGALNDLSAHFTTVRSDLEDLEALKRKSIANYDYVYREDL